MKLKDAILGQFEPDIVVPLIEFGKSLSRINADTLVFMARKSLCLYDVLLRVGIEPAEQCIVSDRVLDMRLDPLVGKRVALIDDTLIVGTTLARAKRRLETEAKASVTVHVFCADEKWWCRDLIKPDTMGLELSDERLMTFCTAEVRALSLVPRPYLVDFPLSRPIRVRIADSQCLLSSVEWTSFRVSTDFQDRNGVSVFTFLPTDDVLSELATGLGEPAASCLDIIKVRAFARKHKELYWVQLVPIVTLGPLKESDLEVLFRALIDRIGAASRANVDKVVYFAHSPRAQQRFVQYVLSAAVGERFMRTVASSIGASIETGYDSQEADRHYGPWLHDEMSEVGRRAFSAIWSPDNRPRTGLPIVIAPAGLPGSVRDWAMESISHDGSPAKVNASRKPGNWWEPGMVNLLTDLTEVFLRLYDKREIPARKEAQELGPRVLDATPQEAPNRDRLEIGVAWSCIVEHLTKQYGISPSREVVNLFTLALDLCNDLGVAVPITCVRDGVVFRAYRHGEDVRFSDGELTLAYEAVKGLLTATQRNAIPRLILEKLLVLLIKVGAARRFLEPLYGPSGVEGVARIGFNLKGAVPVLSRGPKDRADRDLWLSDYLLYRQVLRLDPNRQYALGTPIEGNCLTPTASGDAYELGNILGTLLGSSADPRRRNAPLDVEALTILATCWHPRQAAAALQVELDIFRRWYEEEGRATLRALDWDDAACVDRILRLLLRSNGHEAMHAARMKFVGYKTNRNKHTVENCAKFLKEAFLTDLLARRWSSYWDAMNTLQAVGEKDMFDPSIDRAASFCWEMATYLSTVEVALRSKCAAAGKGRNEAGLRQAFRKLWSYNEAMLSTGLRQPTIVGRLVHRFEEIGGSGSTAFDYQKAFSYSLNGIESRISPIASFVETMEPIIEEFGKIYGRHDYKYMLWYDFFDSTGTHAGESGHDVESYRNRIAAAKRVISEGFHRLSIVARKKNCDIYCWNGNISSGNDEKHAFFRGEFARRYLEDVLAMLLEPTTAWPHVRLRIYVVPCNFAGTGAYRRESDTEVYGQRFWEHWSRLKRTCSKFEAVCGHDRSFLLVATEDLIKGFKIPEAAQWIEPQEAAVTSEVEMLARATKVCYGAIHA